MFSGSSQVLLASGEARMMDNDEFGSSALRLPGCCLRRRNMLASHEVLHIFNNRRSLEVHIRVRCRFEGSCARVLCTFI